MLGLCECGCGTPTKIATQSRTSLGHVKGQPLRYVAGHTGFANMPDPFESKYDVLPNGCWQWKSIVLDGYAYVRVRELRRNVRVHKWLWEKAHGPVPSGMSLDHLCRNRACINIEHLELVTIRENTMRSSAVSALNARKTECVRGHPLSGANLYERNGRRHCRACRADNARERRASA